MICDALMEIIQDKLDEREKQILERAEKQGMKREMQQGMEQGVQLYLKMIQLGRQEDAMKAIEDAEYRKKLFEEFGLQQRFEVNSAHNEKRRIILSTFY